MNWNWNWKAPFDRFTQWATWQTVALGAATGALLILALMTGIKHAHADIIDQLQAADTSLYCAQIGALFKDGFDARVFGAARELKQVTPEMEAEARAAGSRDEEYQVPRDGIYYVYLKQLNEREQLFLARHVFEGWDAAEALLAKGTVIMQDMLIRKSSDITEDMVAQVTQERVNQCAYERAQSGKRTEQDKRSQIAGFVHVASSQALAEPSQVKEHTCAGTAAVALRIREAAATGESIEQFFIQHPFPEDWSEALKAKTLQMVRAAFAFKGSAYDFAAKAYSVCMQEQA